jgi:hypothetical protein
MSSMPPYTPEEVQSCLKVLQALLENRDLLLTWPEAERRTLLMSAGRVSRPDRIEVVRLAKARRRARKEKASARDRELRAEAEIRNIRRQTRFLAPPKADSMPEPESELAQARHCYVCKTEYRRLHFFYDSMCKECGDFNYAKRFQSASLEDEWL